jgi:hypothetical protein
MTTQRPRLVRLVRRLLQTQDGAEAFLRQLESIRACPDTPAWDATHRIGDRMAACPHNPRNGGAGFDGMSTCPWAFDVDDTEGARRRRELGLARDPFARRTARAARRANRRQAATAVSAGPPDDTH